MRSWGITPTDRSPGDGTRTNLPTPSRVSVLRDVVDIKVAVHEAIRNTPFTVKNQQASLEMHEGRHS